METAQRSRPWVLRHLDTIAVGISGLCVIQCLATPVLLTLVPVFAGSTMHGELFHRVLVFFILPTSVLAFFLGCWQHRQWRVLLPAALGLGLIVLAAALGYDRLGMLGETAMTVAGSLSLAWAHIINYRLCRQPRTCREHGES